MAIKDTTRKPYIEDNDENIFIGIDLPFRKSNGVEGYFASTSTTIEAVKNNIRNLVNTHQGERLMQPQLGMNLRKYLFEQFSDETTFSIQNDIVDGVGKNTMNVTIVFNITQDPNTLESVSIEIGE